jgi:hypothetical protein
MAKDRFVCTGVNTGGSFKMRGRPQLESFFKAQRDGEYAITFERLKATRSPQANAYYFGVVLHLLSEYTGYTVEELHEWAKQRFLPQELAICDGNGEVVDGLVLGGTTTTLSKNEFWEYVERIRSFAWERLQVEIPAPDPAWTKAA